MKNRASASARGTNNNLLSHGGCGFLDYSLWLIIFISSVLSFSGYSYRSGVFICAWANETCQDSGKIAFSCGEVKRILLDNGMVALLKESRNLPLASIFLCVRAGSAGEGKFAGTGISHFIEHMVFKGTALHKPGDIFKKIESYGGGINAFTSYDYTGYSITVPSEFIQPSLEILADMLMHPSFDAEQLEKERAVVSKEIRLNYDDPQRYAWRLLWQTAYSTHPYKYPILGEESLFNRLSRDDLLEYHHQRYLPNNMVLAIVGDIDKEKTLNFVKDAFKGFQQRPLAHLRNEPEPEQKQLRRHQAQFTAGLTYLRLGFHSVSIADEDLFALDALSTILAEGKSSRLNKIICDKKRLAYGVEAINYTPLEPGLFIISCLLEEKCRRQVLSLILREIEQLKKREVSKDELECAKNKITSNFIFANQTIEYQAQDLALNEAASGNFRFTERYIQKVEELQPRDILRVTQKYLNQENLSIAALIPRQHDRKPDLPEPGAKQAYTIGIENLNSRTQEAIVATDKDSIGQSSEQKDTIKKYILESGLTLLIREKKDLPLVSITVAFNGGLRAEDAGSNGISNLTAKMFDKGTKSKTAAEIAYLVESKGVQLSSFSGNNSFGFSVELLSKDTEQMLALVADLVINPAFVRREFNRQKQKNLAELKADEDNIFKSGTKLLKATLFKKHPYRFLTIGSAESLKKLTQSDLKKFHRQFCVGRNMVLAVFGDIDAEAVLNKVDNLFGNLNPGESFSATTEKEPQADAVRRAAQFFPKQQTLVLLGFYGSTVFNPDRYVLELLCQILSQPSGKLYTQLRENLGLAYSLGAYSVLAIDPGYIAIYVATTSENTEKANENILLQLRLLQEQPLSEAELAEAQRAIIGKKLISRQTNAACAFESTLDELYGLGYNAYLAYTDKINQIKPEDIQRCANKYLALTNYTLVVIGPSASGEK